MHDPQRERLGILLERAMSLPPDDRARFIEESSGGDAAFHAELASLVEASASSERFFDELAERIGPAIAATVSSGPPPPAADAFARGDVVAHYEILERIGGGMGVVYRARDLRLNRPVALKFLPPSLATHERARARLYAEARTASALDHPNIGGVHEISEAEPGGLFIVLAWCEGETLKEILGRGPLPVAEAVTVARQVAAALAAAHGAGIIHRDVKPSNIIRTPQGVAKLLDFGIAKAADAEPTREGWTPGTVAYMSPEQTRGESVDRRTDIWSLGVVLYEMLAGRRPFRGDHDATVVHAIREDAPEPLAKLRADVPPGLARVVRTCLAKDPSSRYSSAEELLAALETDGAHDAASGRVSRRRPARRIRALGVAASGVSLFLLAAAGLYAVARQDDPGAGPLNAGESAMLAVLPFRVSGVGLEGWEEGMVDLLSTGMDGAAGLRAVDAGSVLARWRRTFGDVGDVDLAAALRVGQATGARFVVEGSAVSIGTKVRLVARVHDLESARRVGVAQVEGSLDSPHALVDGLGVELLRILFGGDVEDLPEVDLAAVTTTSVEALRAYLEGERDYREGRWEDAAAAYLRAVELDSTFALAHHRADLALGWGPPEGRVLQRPHREMARRLSDRLPERERLLVNGTYRMVRNANDSTVLENPIEQAVRMYPGDAEAWYLLAEAYVHRSLLKRPAEVEATFARAIELDSTFAPYRIHYIQYAIDRGDSAEAARRIEGYRAVTDPGEPNLIGFQNSLRLWFADSVTRRALADSLRDVPRPDLLFIGPPPSASHMLREQEFALRFILDLDRGPDPAYFPPEIPLVMRDLARNLANQGRYAEALGLLDHPDFAGTDHRRCILAEFGHIGLPVSEAALRAGMGDPGVVTATLRDAFCGALLAVILGERAAFERGLDRLEAMGEGQFARKAEAYRLWKREGEAERAARMLLMTDGTLESHYWTFWMGDIYRELGRLEEAEEAYLASMNMMAPFVRYSLAWQRLAEIYEESGDRQRAREAWSQFAVAWRDADAELQPKVAGARRRMAALR